MRARLFVVLGLLWLGCSTRAPRSVVLPTFPANVDVAAILFEDGDGRTLSSTGFASIAGPIDIGEPVEGATNVRLVAYRRADLIALGATEEDLAAFAVRRAFDGEPRLPAPGFTATALVFEGEARLEPDSEVVDLTVDWLPECPTLVPEPTPLLDVDCVQRFCDATVEQQGCRIMVSAVGCARGVFFGEVDGQGAVTWGEAGDLGTCTAAEPQEGQRLAMSCTSEVFGECRAAIYTETEEVVTSTRGVSVIDVPSRFDGELGRPHPGHVGPMLVLPDRVWAFDFGGEERRACQTAPNGRGSEIDLETVAVRRTVVLPPCPEAAFYDPAADRVLVAADQADPRLLIFTRDLTPDGEAPIPLTATATGAQFHDLRLSLDGSKVIVLVEERPSRDVYVVSLDRSDLSLVARSEEAFEDTTADVFEYPRGQLATFNHRSGEIVGLEPGSLASDRRASVGAACPGAGFAMGYAYDGATGRYAFAYREPKAAVFHLDESFEGCRAARYFERDASLGGATSIGDTGVVAVGATTLVGTDRAAYLGLVDIEASHFVPRSRRVGTGMISQIIEDGAGRLWLSLPWTGDVVRAELR